MHSMKICVIINLLQAKNAARNKIIEYAVETKERTMRALISVSDKTGVVELAKELEALGIELISTQSNTPESMRVYCLPRLKTS